jgi:predicted site-specific integrase-resolvase
MVMLITKDYTEKLTRGGGLLNTKQTANALGVSERTIIRWRCGKINLEYMMIGQQARYEPEVVQAFKEAQTIRVSSSPSDPQQQGCTA